MLLGQTPSCLPCSPHQPQPRPRQWETLQRALLVQARTCQTERSRFGSRSPSWVRADRSPSSRAACHHAALHGHDVREELGYRIPVDHPKRAQPIQGRHWQREQRYSGESSRLFRSEQPQEPAAARRAGQLATDRLVVVVDEGKLLLDLGGLGIQVAGTPLAHHMEVESWVQRPQSQLGHHVQSSGVVAHRQKGPSLPMHEI